jgi:hypothetical protein
MTISKKRLPLLIELVGLLGFASIGTGLWFIYRPLTFLFIGAILLACVGAWNNKLKGK